MKRREFLAWMATWPSARVFGEGTRVRRSPTLGQQPPPEAVGLFSGGSLSAWTTRGGGAASWRLEGRYMEVNPGSGDILTQRAFTDFHLHLEFWLPDMAGAQGQARANSGVYLQGRYEIQVLDSFGQPPQNDGCGAVYGQAAPLRNASRPPMRWQTYDVAFRAARPPAGEKGRITVHHNGLLIHNNFELAAVTGGALDNNEGQPGPLLLQDHGDRVRYRNVWILAG